MPWKDASTGDRSVKHSNTAQVTFSFVLVLDSYNENLQVIYVLYYIEKFSGNNMSRF